MHTSLIAFNKKMRGIIDGTGYEEEVDDVEAMDFELQSGDEDNEPTND